MPQIFSFHNILNENQVHNFAKVKFAKIPNEFLSNSIYEMLILIIYFIFVKFIEISKSSNNFSKGTLTKLTKIFNYPIFLILFSFMLPELSFSISLQIYTI